MMLNGKTFRVAATAEAGVVSSDTRLQFRHQGHRVFGRYHGGRIARGYLIGTLVGCGLHFRYAQTEADGHVHGGHSRCELTALPDGRLLLTEHFTWETRSGSGTNLFEEVVS
jgi:hypothetical protein